MYEEGKLNQDICKDMKNQILAGGYIDVLISKKTLPISSIWSWVSMGRDTAHLSLLFYHKVQNVTANTYYVPDSLP